MGANVSLVGDDNAYGVALYQSYRNRQQYDHDGDGFSELGKLSAHTFGVNGFYRPTHFSRLGLEYHTTNEFRRGGNKFDLEPHLTDITEQTRHIINSGGVTYDIAWREWAHKLSLFSSVQHIDRNSYYGAQQDPDAYGKTKDLTYVGGATYTGRFSRLLFAPATLTAGVEYQYNSLHDIMTGYNRDLLQDVSIASVYGQGEWTVSKVTLLAGLRLDSHNLIDNPIVSPRLNMMWKAAPDIQTRLTWSTGFRAPQAYDEDLHVTAVGGEAMLITLADGLKPERSNSFSASADWTFRHHHFIFNILGEAFYTSLSDVFYLQTTGTDAAGNTIQERRNGDGASVYGFNIDAKAAHGDNFSLLAGVTFQPLQEPYGLERRPLCPAGEEHVAHTRHLRLFHDEHTARAPLRHHALRHLHGQDVCPAFRRDGRDEAHARLSRTLGKGSLHLQPAPPPQSAGQLRRAEHLQRLPEGPRPRRIPRFRVFLRSRPAPHRLPRLQDQLLIMQLASRKPRTSRNSNTPAQTEARHLVAKPSRHSAQSVGLHSFPPT